MTVAFQDIPSNLRVPFFHVEIGSVPSRSEVSRSLLVGQMLSTGTATADTPVLCTSTGQANTLFGEGSMLARMVAAYLAVDPYARLYCLPVADAGGGTARISTLVVTGTATEAGSFFVYIAGRRIEVSIAAGDDATDIGVAIDAALDAEYGLPCVATNSLGTVTLTWRHKGVAACDGLHGVNLGGAEAGESLPAGVTSIASATGTPGATEPTLTTAIAALGDVEYDFIGWPYTDSTSMAALIAELDARWGWDHQVYGVALSAYRGSQSSAVSWAASYNSADVSALAFQGAGAPAYARAASYAGAAAKSGRNIPSQPLTGLELRGVDPTPETSLYTKVERNVLYNSGVAAGTRKVGGRFDVIDRPTSLYQTDGSGAPDTVWGRIERRVTAMRSTRRFRSAIETTFARCILVADGTPVNPGTPVATPSAIKAAIIGEYEDQVRRAWLQGLEAFEESIIVEINEDNAERVDVYMAPQLASQLGVVATRAEFGE